MHKLSELTDQELLVIQKTGIDVNNFIHGDMFVRILKPAFEAEREHAKQDGDWMPGKTTELEAVAMFNAFNSGKRAGLRAIETIIGKVINRGTDAGAEYERRLKKPVKK